MPAELGTGPYTLPELTDYFRKGLEALEQMQGAAPEGDMLAEEAIAEVTPEGAAVEEAAVGASGAASSIARLRTRASGTASAISTEPSR